jgi:hypothetical protein
VQTELCGGCPNIAGLNHDHYGRYGARRVQSHMLIPLPDIPFDDFVRLQSRNERVEVLLDVLSNRLS